MVNLPIYLGFSERVQIFWLNLPIYLSSIRYILKLIFLSIWILIFLGINEFFLSLYPIWQSTDLLRYFSEYSKFFLDIDIQEPGKERGELILLKEGKDRRKRGLRRKK